MLCASRGAGVVLLLLLIPVTSRAADPTARLEARLLRAAGADRIDVLTLLAGARGLTSAPDSARTAREAVEAARALGDRRREAAALRAWAKAKVVAGEPEEALSLGRRALSLSESVRDVAGAGEAAADVAAALRMTGRVDDALAAARLAVTRLEPLGPTPAVVRALVTLGGACADSGDVAAGTEHVQHALRLARTAGDPATLAVATRAAAEIRLAAQDLDGAVRGLLEARRLSEAAADLGGLALTEIALGRGYTAMRQADHATPAFAHALELATRVGDRAAQGASEIGLGNMAFVSRNPAQAIVHYRTAADLARATHRQGALATALDSMGLVHRVEGRLDEGRAVHLLALTIREALGDRAAIGRSLGNLGHVEVEMGRDADAERHLQRALAIGEATKNATLQDALEILTRLREKQGRYREALEYYTRHVAERERHLNERSIQSAAAERERYDAEKRELALAELGARNALLARETEVQTLRARVLALALALAGVLAILLLRRYRHLLAFWKRRHYVGAYRLLGPLGGGGMGEVFEAAHIRDTTRRVAVKLLRTQFTNDPIFRQRFKREGILIDQLDHPHIVKVFERGEHDQRLYIAMELVQGPTLAELVRAGTRLPLADCLAVMAQLVDALARIHAVGIVHRDVKPENVMLSETAETQPFVKLLDFDIAKSQSLTRLTETGEILGTVSYLAPEQITTQTSSPASDTHALGVVFYELLTLERPFLGEAPMDIVRQILEADPVPPASLRPDIPADLSALVVEMLSKTVERRPDDAALASRLSAIAVAA